MKRLLFITLILSTFIASSRELFIGEWQGFLPYQNAQSVMVHGDKVYCATGFSMYVHNFTLGGYVKKTKTNGLSDIIAKKINYHPERDLIFLAYENGNIDLINGNGVQNIPDIKISAKIGNKTVNDIYFHGNLAYLSMNFGVVVINLDKREVKDTYDKIGPLGDELEVYSSSILGDEIFLATEIGVLKGNLADGSNLIDFNSWSLQTAADSFYNFDRTTAITTLGNSIYAVGGDSLYKYDSNGWSVFLDLMPNWDRPNLTSSNGQLVLLEIVSTLENAPVDSARVLIIDEMAQETILLEGNELASPQEVRMDKNGTIWVADLLRGLLKFENGALTTKYPNGPVPSAVWDMAFVNNSLWAVSGGITTTWIPAFNTIKPTQLLNQNFWQNYNEFVDPEMADAQDMLAIAGHPKNGKTYIASYFNGIFVHDGESFTRFDQFNSGLLGVPSGNPEIAARTYVSDITFDRDENLWALNLANSKDLALMTPEGDWYNFNVLNNSTPLKKVITDNFGQVWIVPDRTTAYGLIVYNPGEDITSPFDDQIKKLSIGQGAGNLPSNEVFSIVKDRDGEIWVGTEQGIAIFYCPGSVVTDFCDADQIIIDQDGINGLLLGNEKINDIQVDGANRKWIATDNGVFLMSPDGLREIEHFTTENSPLFSNSVTNIAIDHESGRVYLGTQNGIMAYRGTATNGKEFQDEPVTVFPNPVLPTYTGIISMNGFIENATVRITDAAGRLVYETTALGGQAIWDGNKIGGGGRVSSGVYLVHSTNSDGLQTQVSKFVIIK